MTYYIAQIGESTYNAMEGRGLFGAGTDAFPAVPVNDGKVSEKTGRLNVGQTAAYLACGKLLKAALKHATALELAHTVKVLESMETVDLYQILRRDGIVASAPIGGMVFAVARDLSGQAVDDCKAIARGNALDAEDIRSENHDRIAELKAIDVATAEHRENLQLAREERQLQLTAGE